MYGLEQVDDHLFLFVTALAIEQRGIVFGCIATVNEQGGVATIVNDQVRTLAAGEAERFVRAPPVFLERLTLPREDRYTSGSDGCGGMVLGGEDVTAGPTYVGTQIDKCLDEDGGLDGHMERAHDACAGQRFLSSVFLAQGHEARHFVFCDLDLFTAEVGQIDVCHFVGQLFR